MPVTLEAAIKKYKVPLLPPEPGDLKGGAPPITLPFDMQRQTQNQWCWAATSASVSLYYDDTSTWTQCLVAEQIMGSSCCVAPAPCNKPWYLDQALSVTDNFNTQSGPMTFAAVEQELASRRVVGARVGWRGGGGHFMVIYGCRTVNGVNYYRIDDPIYGKSELTESAFLSNYQGAGAWTHSYTTKP